ncbi:hypothetical protein CY34DRAFT_717547 [Suillus luteus UH-Slu-Lm8-n1]|uniref:Uncharacterized protein n=1 Tax=Suillus luteus UH-Slu-Lm8-n1 TaxID=930992 RepID=A0A0D0BAM2_9AGAM|nr:hypothetical protein CY34DRAFT_717547 [Suillus luteus UH-Slu-Lm8-n1]
MACYKSPRSWTPGPNAQRPALHPRRFIACESCFCTRVFVAFVRVQLLTDLLASSWSSALRCTGQVL